MHSEATTLFLVQAVCGQAALTRTHSEKKSFAYRRRKNLIDQEGELFAMCQTHSDFSFF